MKKSKNFADVINGCSPGRSGQDGRTRGPEEPFPAISQGLKSDLHSTNQLNEGASVIFRFAYSEVGLIKGIDGRTHRAESDG